MKRNPKRERWMALFEQALVAQAPAFAGKVPWDAAVFHHSQGTSPGLAAAKVANSETPVGLTWPHGVAVSDQ